jgi:hypothetical protein
MCDNHCPTVGDFIGRFFQRTSWGCGQRCGCGCRREPKRCFTTEMRPCEPKIVKRCVCHEEEVLIPQPPIPVRVEIPCHEPPCPEPHCPCDCEECE